MLRFTAQLRTVGILVPPREIERFIRIVINVTIEYATYICWRTNTVFHEGKHFEFKDIYKTQEFLFATEEITLFVLSLMSSVFFHPQEHIVM
jgi:hypothetical protein